jgi:hypothetical protein
MAAGCVEAASLPTAWIALELNAPLIGSTRRRSAIATAKTLMRIIDPRLMYDLLLEGSVTRL